MTNSRNMMVKLLHRDGFWRAGKRDAPYASWNLGEACSASSILRFNTRRNQRGFCWEMWYPESYIEDFDHQLFSPKVGRDLNISNEDCRGGSNSREKCGKAMHQCTYMHPDDLQHRLWPGFRTSRVETGEFCSWVHPVVLLHLSYALLCFA